MTREEAIKIIDCYDIGFYDLSGEKIPADKLADALDVAIEALERERTDEWCDDCKEYEIAERNQWKADVEAIKSVPPADRPRGEWIETAQDYYETLNKKGGGVNEGTEYFTDDIACSECLTKFSNIDNETERFNFCPNCGAKMDGERSER